MILIDGTHSEGGGSLLRLSIALSIQTQKPFKIINIRLKRKKPGLNSQNLASIALAQKISDAKVVGAKRGSKEIEFYPNKIKNKKIEYDIGSAGSIFLVIQAIFLPCILSGKNFTFKIKGGTDVAWSPGYDYFKEVYLPFFEKYAKYECTLHKRGYYPKGQGEVTLKIKSYKNTKQEPIQITNLGKLITIKGVSTASKDLEQEKYAEQEAQQATMQLKEQNVPININTHYNETASTGNSLLIYGVFEQEQKILRTGIYFAPPKEKTSIAKELTDKFKKLIQENTPLDEFLADQIIPFLGILNGEIKTTHLDKHLSKHLHANTYVTEKFLNKKITITKEGYIKSE